MSDAQQPFLFDSLGSRRVQADFSGGHLSSDGGALLLRQVNRGLGVTRHLAACFEDARHPGYVDHWVEELLDQRIGVVSTANGGPAPPSIIIAKKKVTPAP